MSDLIRLNQPGPIHWLDTIDFTISAAKQPAYVRLNCWVSSNPDVLAYSQLLEYEPDAPYGKEFTLDSNLLQENSSHYGGYCIAQLESVDHSGKETHPSATMQFDVLYPGT